MHAEMRESVIGKNLQLSQCHPLLELPNILGIFQSGALHCVFTPATTHPHAGLQADLWHDWEEGDASIHPSTLGTDNLVWVWRLWEVCGATFVCCQGYRCYVRTLRERWDRCIRWAAFMDWKPLGHIVAHSFCPTCVMKHCETWACKCTFRFCSSEVYYNFDD